MKNLAATSDDKSTCIITRSYTLYHQPILNYINYKIKDTCTAEDLAHDVFLRLLDYKPMLQESTVKYFLFTIARNIVTDYLRRYYKKHEITTYIYDTTELRNNQSDDNVIVKDLLRLERNKLQTFSPQRKTVYLLSRFHEKTTHEISQYMQLSKRTVENHLLTGRKIMREYMRQCI